MDVKVIEGRAARVATNAAATDPDKILGQLTRVWHRCWAEKTERLTRNELASIFGRQIVDAIIEAMVIEEFLCPVACSCTRCAAAAPREGGHRVAGAHKFTRLREAFSKGGKMRQGNVSPRAAPLEHGPDPEIPRSRDPESSSTPEYRDPEYRDPETASQANGGGNHTDLSTGKKLNDEQATWQNLEIDRVIFCEKAGLTVKRFGVPPKARATETIRRAISDLGFPEGDPMGLRELEQLFENYLADEDFGRYDKEGNDRKDPWPVPLFLSRGVLERLKREAAEAH